MNLSLFRRTALDVATAAREHRTGNDIDPSEK
jgi:hypothetical protein